MKLFWYDSPLDTEDDVKRKASSVDVRPLQLRVNPDDFIIIHRPLNARALDNHVGYSESIDLVISEDSFASSVTIGLTAVYIRELVFSWERAKFKWIQDATVNSGSVLQVKFADAPVRSHPEDFDYFHETEYHLLGDVFHFSH